MDRYRNYIVEYGRNSNDLFEDEDRAHHHHEYIFDDERIAKYQGDNDNDNNNNNNKDKDRDNDQENDSGGCGISSMMASIYHCFMKSDKGFETITYKSANLVDTLNRFVIVMEDFATTFELFLKCSHKIACLLTIRETK